MKYAEAFRTTQGHSKQVEAAKKRAEATWVLEGTRLLCSMIWSQVTALATTFDAGAALAVQYNDTHKDVDLNPTKEPSSFGPFEADADESQVEKEFEVQHEARVPPGLEQANEDTSYLQDVKDVKHEHVEYKHGNGSLPMVVITSAAICLIQPPIFHDIYLDTQIEEQSQSQEPTPMIPDTLDKPLTDATQAHASILEGDESTLV
jgi:hypothetical protein